MRKLTLCTERLPSRFISVTGYLGYRKGLLDAFNKSLMKKVLAPFYDPTLDQSRMRQFVSLVSSLSAVSVPAQNECSDFPNVFLSILPYLAIHLVTCLTFVHEVSFNSRLISFTSCYQILFRFNVRVCDSKYNYVYMY